MSGHAVLDSCHNCGKTTKKLNVVLVKTDCACGGIHVIVACDSCKEKIWDK